MTTYRIPSWNVSDFESKMNRFTNKAKKLNIPFGFTLESKETVKVIDPLTAWDSYRTDYIYSVYGESLLKIESFLPYAIQSINKQGYKKSDSDNPTKYDSLNRYFVPKEKLTDFEIEEAKKILSYVQNKLNEKMVNAKNNNMFGITEYDITLLKLIEYGYMSEKHSGYIVSIIPMYHL